MTTSDTEKLTEKKLAENFERIDEGIRERVRQYQTEPIEPVLAPYVADEVVIEPVYAYTIHAVR